MRNLLVLLTFALLVALAAPAANEEASSVIAVKGSETSSGVVTLHIVKGAKAYELTCNQGMPGCTSLKNATYRMTVLPKNRGMYDCQNVKVYAEAADTSGDEQELGAYCLLDK